MIEVSAKDILHLNTDQLRAVRVKCFEDFGERILGHRDAQDKFLQFTYLLMLVQDMAAWRKLAEPGIAAHIDPDDPDWADEIDDARWLDRNSIEMHNDITTEFYAKGGTDKMQESIDFLNEFAQRVPKPKSKRFRIDD